jgi:hypothetical protein
MITGAFVMAVPDARLAGVATGVRLFKDVGTWNAWAMEMLAVKIDSPLLNLWSMFAEADLANEKFPSTFDAATAIFPGALNLSRASFERDTWFNYANFKGPSTFENALFRCDADPAG